VVLLNAFAYITIRLRPWIFGVTLFRPMIKNFKLSLLPLLILVVDMVILFILIYMSNYWNIEALRTLGYAIFFVGLLVWLLFLPNSGYLITELNMTHRSDDINEVPIWYDIVSVMSFALSGVVNTLANIVIIQLFFIVLFDPTQRTTLLYSTIFLSGLTIVFLIVTGIYLGRMIRFNSWDVLHPVSFAGKLRAHFSNKGAARGFVLYVLFNTVFFMIMYVAFGIPFLFMK
jgi:uncharacterized membrane protein